MLIICPIGTSRWLWRLTLPDFNLTSTATLPCGLCNSWESLEQLRFHGFLSLGLTFCAETRALEGQEASRPARWQEQRLDARAS